LLLHECSLALLLLVVLSLLLLLLPLMMMVVVVLLLLMHLRWETHHDVSLICPLAPLLLVELLLLLLLPLAFLLHPWLRLWWVAVLLHLVALLVLAAMAAHR
jgi:hypothetical protein